MLLIQFVCVYVNNFQNFQFDRIPFPNSKFHFQFQIPISIFPISIWPFPYSHFNFPNPFFLFPFWHSPRSLIFIFSKITIPNFQVKISNFQFSDHSCQFVNFPWSQFQFANNKFATISVFQMNKRNEGSLWCQTPTCTVRLKFEKYRVKNGGCGIKNEEWMM